MFIVIINTLTTMLTLMLVTVAALGVLNIVVLETRERVHDLGVHKALGMTPPGRPSPWSSPRSSLPG